MMMTGKRTAGPVGIEAPPKPPPEDMVWVPGGSFLMGSDAFYPEEGPVHPVIVDGFWSDGAWLDWRMSF
jgi:formylglycine-generating enzyme required for sulfatase activity